MEHARSGDEPRGIRTPHAARNGQVRRLLVWLLLAALAVMLGYAAFRGYLYPGMLIDFSNAFYC